MGKTDPALSGTALAEHQSRVLQPATSRDKPGVDVALGCGKTKSARRSLGAFGRQAGPGVRDQSRPAQRKLEHPRFVFRAGAASRQLESAPGSNRCAVCVRCQRSLELVCRRRVLSSRLSQRDPGSCSQPRPTRPRLSAQTTGAGRRRNLAAPRKKNHAQGQPLFRGWTNLVATGTCVL